jgi:hypothetical protein
MKKILLFGFIALSLFACKNNEAGFESKNPHAAFFYPWDTVPKIYLYRDVANGLDEQFHRIYSLSDSEGDHIVVEIYAMDGRIIEALNFNTDSLDVMDHMVVNRNLEKTKAEVFKTGYIPMKNGEETWFASRFPGVLDSTLLLKEVKRKIDKTEKHEVLGAQVETLITSDKLRMTSFNPFTKKENSHEIDVTSYFAKGYGLVEWHSASKKAHYRLEQVLTQEDWIKIITR